MEFLQRQIATPLFWLIACTGSNRFTPDFTWDHSISRFEHALFITQKHVETTSFMKASSPMLPGNPCKNRQPYNSTMGLGQAKFAPLHDVLRPAAELWVLGVKSNMAKKTFYIFKNKKKLSKTLWRKCGCSRCSLHQESLVVHD